MNTPDSLTEIGKIMARAESTPVTLMDVITLINRRVARAGKNFSGSTDGRTPGRPDRQGGCSPVTKRGGDSASGYQGPSTENPLHCGPEKAQLGENLRPDHPLDAKPVRGSGSGDPTVQAICRQVAVPPDKTGQCLSLTNGEAQEGTETEASKASSCGLSANSILAAASDGLESEAQQFGWIEEEE